MSKMLYQEKCNLDRYIYYHLFNDEIQRYWMFSNEKWRRAADLPNGQL